MPVNTTFAGVREDRQNYMSQEQANNPLHGITLEMIVTQLVDHYGWADLGRCIKIRCFLNDPSIKSSLKFLRRTPWAREQVEELYLETIVRFED